MHSFRMWRDEASVSRQSYTGGKSSFGATIATYKGYLRTLSPTKDQIGLEAFGKEFSFTTVYGADIKEADKLTIAGISYRVKWIAFNQGISVSTTKVLLTRIDVWS